MGIFTNSEKIQNKIKQSLQQEALVLEPFLLQKNYIKVVVFVSTTFVLLEKINAPT